MLRLTANYAIDLNSLILIFVQNLLVPRVWQAVTPMFAIADKSVSPSTCEQTCANSVQNAIIALLLDRMRLAAHATGWPTVTQTFWQSADEMMHHRLAASTDGHFSWLSNRFSFLKSLRTVDRLQCISAKCLA